MKNLKLSLVIIAFFLVSSFVPSLWGRSPSTQPDPSKTPSSGHQNKVEADSKQYLLSAIMDYITSGNIPTQNQPKTYHAALQLIGAIFDIDITDSQVSKIVSKHDMLTFLQSLVLSQSGSEESESTSWDTTLTLSVATELLNGSTYSGSNYLTAEFLLKGTTVIKLNCDTFNVNSLDSNRGTAKCTTTDIGDFDYADFDSISLVAIGSLEVKIKNYIVSIAKEPSEITEYSCLPSTVVGSNNDCTSTDEVNISLD